MVDECEKNKFKLTKTQKREGDLVRAKWEMEVCYGEDMPDDMRLAIEFFDMVTLGICSRGKVLCEHSRSEYRNSHRFCLDCGQRLPRWLPGNEAPDKGVHELPEQCWHPTWAWRKGTGPAYKDKPMQRYCTQCNQNLPSHPELERAHRPYAICSHPNCPQCKLEDEAG
jgi:hypothetical protein